MPTPWVKKGGHPGPSPKKKHKGTVPAVAGAGGRYLPPKWGGVTFEINEECELLLREVFDMLDGGRGEQDGVLDGDDLLRPEWGVYAGKTNEDLEFLRDVLSMEGGVPKDGLTFEGFKNRIMIKAMQAPCKLHKWRKLPRLADNSFHPDAVMESTLDWNEMTIERLLERTKERINKVIKKFFLSMKERLERTSHIHFGTINIYRENVAMLNRIYTFMDLYLGDSDGELDSEDTSAWTYLLANSVAGEDESSMSREEFFRRLAHRAMEEPFVEQDSTKRVDVTFDIQLAFCEYHMNQKLHKICRGLCGGLTATGLGAEHNGCPAVGSPDIKHNWRKHDVPASGVYGGREWGNYQHLRLPSDVPFGLVPALDGSPSVGHAVWGANCPPLEVASNLTLSDTNVTHIKRLFSTKDKDGNGELSAGDFTTAREQEWWTQVVTGADADGDGRVTIDEFLQAFERIAMEKVWTAETEAQCNLMGCGSYPSIQAFVYGESAFISMRLLLNQEVLTLVEGLSY